MAVEKNQDPVDGVAPDRRRKPLVARGGVGHSYSFVRNEVISRHGPEAFRILGIDDDGDRRVLATAVIGEVRLALCEVEDNEYGDTAHELVAKNPHLFELNHGLFAHHVPHPSQVPHHGDRSDLTANWVQMPPTGQLGDVEPSYSGMRASPLHMNPLHMNPLDANPLHMNPLHMNPLHMNPLHMNPLHMNGLVSSAVPTTPDRRDMGGEVPTQEPVGELDVMVYIIDTGLGGAGQGNNNYASEVLPNYATVDGDNTDAPDLLDAWSDTKRPANPAPGRNQYVDPVAGHGTFIAGIYGQLLHARGIHAGIVVRDGVDERGIIDEWTAATKITDIAAAHDGPPGVLNLSFGGTTSDLAPGGLNALQLAVDAAVATNLVVVASAGNVSSPERHYPAAFDAVIGVGALDEGGVAWFSNYDEPEDRWIACWAPGVDIISPFLDLGAKWKSPLSTHRGIKMQGFFKSPVFPKETEFDGFADTGVVDAYSTGWVAWSGTSFAAPIAGALAAETLVGDPDPAKAKQVVLERYPLRPV